MKKILLSILFVSLTTIVVKAQGQQASANSKLSWDQDAADLTTASSMTYKYYLDSSTTGISFTTVTCTGTQTPFVCTVQFPTLNAGNHTIAVTASNAAGESAQSSPLSFTFLVAPAAPKNLRVSGH